MHRPARARATTVATPCRLACFSVALVLLGLACGQPGADPLALEAALAAAVGRPVEPRLSAGFAYLACRPGTSGLIPEPRCGEAPRGAVLDVLEDLGAQVDEALRRERTAAALHTQGLLHLVWHELDGELDQAVGMLREAAEVDPADAGVLNDLAAAHLVRAQRFDRPLDLVDAFDAADRATAADPDLDAAWFNRGLAASKLFLDAEARASWERLIAADADSPWTREARERLAALPSGDEGFWERLKKELRNALAQNDEELSRSLVRSHRETARKLGEREVLRDWAESHLRDDEEEAARHLEQARLLGRLLADGGDDLLSAAVAAIGRHTGSARDRLARGHRAFALGAAHHDAYATDLAEERFLEAEEALAKSPFAARADFELAVLAFRKARYLEALRRLAEIEDGLPEGRPYLRGRIAWIRGLCQLGIGNPTASLKSYARSRELLRATGEDGNAAFVSLLMAQVDDHLGREDEAWSHLYQALAACPRLPDRKRIHAIYYFTGDTLLRAGRPRSALFFLTAVVALHGSGDAVPADAAHAYLKRARLRVRLGRFDDALADVVKAEGHLAAIDGESTRRLLESDLLVVRAGIVERRDPAAAVRLLSDALAYHYKGDNIFFLPRLHRARARARLAGGDLAAAETDLRMGIEAVEKQLPGIEDPNKAVSYLHESAPLYEDLLSLAERMSHARSFEIAERLHGRVVADLTLKYRATDERPIRLSADGIVERLPEGLTVVEYALLKERSLAWIARRGRPIRQVVLAAGEDAVKNAVDDFLSKLARPGPEVTSTTLHEILVEPLLADLDGAGTILFVPEKSLHHVPFAALFDGQRYLVETRAVGVAPSATHLVRATERKVESTGTAFVVGDPAFDRVLLPELGRLDHALAEARAVTSAHGGLLVTGTEATARQFLQNAGEHAVVHFAGHAVSHALLPERSFLALAPDNEDSGLLLARDVAGRTFPHTRLVVLSACSTAGGEGVRPEAGLPLAQAFLAAGVPAVVASLWNVGDRSTLLLMGAFHERLATGDNPWQALRHAQLRMLEGDDVGFRSPRAWAAFQVYGGGAPRQPATER